MVELSTTHMLILALLAFVLLVKPIIFWSTLLLILLSPVLGIICSCKHSSGIRALGSLDIPFYGFVYFLAPKPQAAPLQPPEQIQLVETKR